MVDPSSNLIWKTADGRCIPIKDLEDRHLVNILYYVTHKNPKREARLGTPADMELRAIAIQGLAKRLKYGSVAFYAAQLEEAGASGSKAAVKDAFGPVANGISGAIKLDANKKTYGKCGCSKYKFKCKAPKKKK